MNRQVDVSDLLTADEAGHGGSALVELAQLQPGEGLRLPKDRRQRINAFHVRQPIQIAFGLLGNFQRRPKHDGRILRNIRKEMS